MQEMQVQSLGWGDPLEKKMATHASILAWKIPWTEELGMLTWGHKEPDTTEQLHFQACVRLSPGRGNGTSILTWRIPWTEQPGSLQSTESQ